jgi:hypothetical protein
MKGIACNARRQLRGPELTDSLMMITAKQNAARRTVTCPTHHLALGMA